MSTLILVPTMVEMNRLRPALTTGDAGHDFSFQLCGFGPIAAAARCAALLSRYRPERAMLVGIAGTYDPECMPIGTANHFELVACDGVGVGMGGDFQSAADLGWAQFDGDGTAPRVGDRIPLDAAPSVQYGGGGMLVTCPAASASIQEAELRKSRYPGANAEDMEGFAVAAACLLAGVPLQIVRGISNRAGDRAQQGWAVEQALASAAEMAGDLISRPWSATVT